MTVELKVLDRKTRKRTTLFSALHPRSDVERVHVERQKGGRGLIGREIYVKVEENNLAWYFRNSNERVMAGIRKIKIFYSEGAKEKNEFKRERQNASLNSWKEKKCMVNYCGKCQRQLIKIRPGSGLEKLTWKLKLKLLFLQLKNRHLKRIIFNIDNSVDHPLSRMCNRNGETISHILSECILSECKKN